MKTLLKPNQLCAMCAHCQPLVMPLIKCRKDGKHREFNDVCSNGYFEDKNNRRKENETTGYTEANQRRALEGELQRLIYGRKSLRMINEADLLVEFRDRDFRGKAIKDYSDAELKAIIAEFENK